MKSCILQILDEVNCKITGLEPTTRRKLTNLLSYEMAYARHTPAYKLGRWNGKVAYFTVGGASYINLLPVILPVLEDEGYDIDLVDNRDYERTFEFEPITEELFAHKVWPKGHPAEGQPILLRDYQVEIVNRFFDNQQSIQVAATGSGKTITCAAMSYQCEQYGRTIVVVPNKSLVLQTEEDYKNIGLDVGVFFGDRKEYDKTHTICTWQSLSSLFKKSKKGEAQIDFAEFIEGVVTIIIDEAHGIKGDELKSLLTGPFACVPIRWGLTGTIPKEDYAAAALLVSIGPVVGELQAHELQDMGVLSSCNVNIWQLEDYVEYKDYASELKYLVTTEKRLDFLAEKIVEIAKTGNTLILVDRKATGEYLESVLPGSIFINGDIKAGTRKEHYDEINFATNSITIATYGVASTGINITKLDNLMLLESGKSFVRVIQSIGRALRKGFGKDHAEIYDVCSTMKFSKRHLTERKKFYKEAQYKFSITKMNWQQ
jgi:superfamily II DNA or RNA helicase